MNITSILESVNSAYRQPRYVKDDYITEIIDKRCLLISTSWKDLVSKDRLWLRAEKRKTDRLRPLSLSTTPASSGVIDMATTWNIVTHLPVVGPLLESGREVYIKKEGRKLSVPDFQRLTNLIMEYI